MIGDRNRVAKNKWISKLKKFYQQSRKYYRTCFNCESITDVLDLKDSKKFKKCTVPYKTKIQQMIHKKENRKLRRKNKIINDFEFD